MDLIGKIRYLAAIPQTYKNFLQGYIAGLGFLDKKKEYVFSLRNGLKISVSGSAWDFFILNEIFIIKE